MSHLHMILRDGIILPSEICVCGHSWLGHSDKVCFWEPTCNCKWLRPLFLVDLPTNFFHDHDDSPMGHALIKGVLAQIEEGREVHLIDGDLGRKPSCHRCGRFTKALMPVLVNKRSRQRVKEVAKGIMSRLWCRDCVEKDGGTYDSTIELAITEGLRSRQLGYS